IRGGSVTGVQTCALPISAVAIRGRLVLEPLAPEDAPDAAARARLDAGADPRRLEREVIRLGAVFGVGDHLRHRPAGRAGVLADQIGRASCRERGWSTGVG